MYSQSEFNKEVLSAIILKTNYLPTDEECKAVAHHMEYNIRADKNFANNGHLTISTSELRKRILWQIHKNLHKNDIPRYFEQYQKYKYYQKYCLLSRLDKEVITDIAMGKKKISDYQDKEKLKNIYIKYFNQIVMPKIEKISMQKKYNLLYHGLWHTEQVAMLSIDIALSENQNPLPILLAAGLHDCARTTDKHDSRHAINCRPIAENFLQNYSDRTLISNEQQKQIVDAVIFHNSSSKPQNNLVLNCLQDADSMRLLWNGRQKFIPNTYTGKLLANYSPREQIKYLVPLIEIMRATSPSLARNCGNIFTR